MPFTDATYESKAGNFWDGYFIANYTFCLKLFKGLVTPPANSNILGLNQFISMELLQSADQLNLQTSYV